MQTPGQNRNPAANRLILVGASVRAAAESAGRAGFSVIALDHFGDRETIRSSQRWISLPERPRISDLGEALPSDDASEIAIAGGLQSGFRWLEDATVPIRGATPAWFERSAQPQFLRQLAKESGTHFPETRTVDDLGGELRGGMWLEKDITSSGGLGVRLYDPQSRSSNRLTASLQRRIRGDVYGATYVGLGNRSMLLGVCRSLKKRVRAQPFFYAGAVGPVSLETQCVSRLQRLGNAFAERSGIIGPFNIDVVFDGERLWLLEVNPRWSSSMELIERAWMEKVNDCVSLFDSPDQWVRRTSCSDAEAHVLTGAMTTWVKRVVYAKRDLRVQPSEFGAKYADARWEWKDVPRATMLIRQHQPIASLITSLDRMSLREVFRVSL